MKSLVSFLIVVGSLPLEAISFQTIPVVTVRRPATTTSQLNGDLQRGQSSTDLPTAAEALVMLSQAQALRAEASVSPFLSSLP